MGKFGRVEAKPHCWNGLSKYLKMFQYLGIYEEILPSVLVILFSTVYCPFLRITGK